MSESVSNNWEYQLSPQNGDNSGTFNLHRFSHDFDTIKRIVDKGEGHASSSDGEEIKTSMYKLFKQSEDQNYSAHEQVKFRQRKRKHGNEIRNYICGCGKQYLSYSALFCHTRYKHDGKQVEGTIKNFRSANSSRKGRPKKDNKQNSNSNKPKTQKSEQNLSLVETAKHLPLFPISKKQMKMFEGYFDIIEGNCNFEKSITFPKFISIIKGMKQKNKESVKLPSSVDDVLAVFLYNMALVCNSSFLSQIQMTFQDLRQCINSCYKTILHDSEASFRIFRIQLKHNKQTEGQDYTSSNTHKIIPFVCQYFVSKYLPSLTRKVDLKLTSSVLVDLCNWMVKYNMGSCKIYKNNEEMPLNLLNKSPKLNFLDQIYIQ